jgi:hypothetical protein
MKLSAACEHYATTSARAKGLAEYEPVLDDYARRLQVLRDAIRRDLGVKGSSPQVPL